MRRLAGGAALVLFAFGCRGEVKPDAYGNMEATEVVVGAETSGQIEWFVPVEGMQIALATPVALIDTTQLALQREQITAQRSASDSRVSEVRAQMEVLAVQRDIAQRNYERTRRLFEQQAATAQQLDQAEREYRTLTQQIEASRSQITTVSRDASASNARVAQIADQIRKSVVRNPRAGTVLAVYSRAGEFVQVGAPLYRIANLGELTLRAYVSETQLAHIKIGQPAQVSIDVGPEERRVFPGKVTWISSQAEFTPTPVQTREERADLVYAVKITVPNQQGVLKIGMPADVRFTAVQTAAQ
jgi:HlyD family secretion protein